MTLRFKKEISNGISILLVATTSNFCFANIVDHIADCDQIYKHCPEAILFETTEKIYLVPEKIRAGSRNMGSDEGGVNIYELFVASSREVLKNLSV